MNRIVISVIGRDCPGVVYAITSALAKEKCNVEQLSQTILKGQFASIVIISAPEGVTEENGMYTYTCPISDTQILAVQVALDGDSYRILRWQALSSVSWEADDRIPVWDGTGE